MHCSLNAEIIYLPRYTAEYKAVQKLQRRTDASAVGQV